MGSSNSSEKGGYDACFVESVPEFLQCIICQLALKQPLVVIECGHKFCANCFNKTKEHAINSAIELCCPLDREVIDPTKVFPDKAAERLVFDLKVKCENTEKGCEWNGDLRSLENHLKEVCKFESELCGIEGCTIQIERRLLEDHKKSCPNKLNESQMLNLIRELQRKVAELEVEKKSEQKSLDLCIESQRSQLEKYNVLIDSQSTEISRQGIEISRQCVEIQELKERMNVLSDKSTIIIWNIKDYADKRKEKEVWSPFYYTSLAGYRVRLQATWNGPKLGRLGIFLYVYETNYQHELKWPFPLTTFFEAIDSSGKKHTRIMKDFKGALNDFGCGFDNFISMPTLQDCVKNNCLTIRCWFD